MTSVSKHGPKIMVVDDDPIFRQLAIARLQKTVSRATDAQDGLDAWQLIKTGDFDLALIDLDMPNMNGFSLIQCIRSFPATQQMPLIVITSRDDVSSVQKALEVGATGFLTKPVNWSMFLPYIEHMLTLSRAASEARTARREAAALADIRGSTTEILNTELRSRSRRIAATARRVLEDAATSQNVEKLREALKLAYSEANAQRSAVEALSPYTNLLTNPAKTGPAPHSLATLLATAKSDCTALVEQRQVRLNFGTPDTVDLHCTRDIFVRTVGDMLAHAIERSPAGSPVALNTQHDADGLHLHVTSMGEPLPLHLQRYLGEDAGPTHAPIPPIDAAGEIRLVMAASLAQMIGGRLIAFPAQDEGSTIRLTIPAEHIYDEPSNAPIVSKKIAV